MIAKLIVWGKDRDQARARMVQALAQTKVVGVHTNVAFLTRLMTDTAFATGDLDTGLIERQRSTLLPPAAPARPEALALAVAALLGCEAPSPSGNDPWAQTDGWRVDGVYRRELLWAEQEVVHRCVLQRQGAVQVLEIEGECYPFKQRKCETTVAGAFEFELTLGAALVLGTVVLRGERYEVFSSGKMSSLIRQNPLAQAGGGQVELAGGLTAPMPGKVIAVHVSPGDKVKRGQALLVMEAMKMEHTIAAPTDSVVKALLYAVGDQVSEGAALITLD